ncbi:hypothetical protein SNE40_010386 [Patella caerulea]|uniref:Uncharacterized protein n=1 Tax=Patella caerulea TaxID=87958 RepID=A0AAN8JRR3_PATCE
MDQSILLPKLNNPRLKEVGRQQNLSRKRVTITNDKLKKTYLRLNCNLQREARVQNYLNWQQSVAYKKSLVEHKGLQVCLRRKREYTKSLPTFQNGVYNGMKLDAMKSEVKRVIWEQHPRTRRMREVEKTKQLWKKNGNIVDYNKTLQSLDAIIKRQRDVLPSITVERPTPNPRISLVSQKSSLRSIENRQLLVLPSIYTIRSVT